VRAELGFLAGIVAFAVLTMPVYRFRFARRGLSRTTASRGGTFVLGLWVRDWFYWFISPLKRLSLALQLGPVFFNVLGVLFGLASMTLFWTGHFASAGWMILLSGIADMMDGEIARERGVASSMGAFLDSTLDRFTEFFVFIGMAAFYGSGVAVLLIVVALGGSLLVSYTRARGESLGVTCKGGLMQRAERMLVLGFGAILDPTLSRILGRDPGAALLFILAIVAAGTVATSVYRTIWIARRLREL
jgi:phosphatidylglycerophosphate synthase